MRSASSARGQAMVEMAICLPLVTILALGVSEFGYALLDAHVATKMTREGSNLISRDTTIADAVVAMRSMASRPVNFDDGSSKLIFSVVKRVNTAGAANFNQNVLYQRFIYGSYGGASKITTSGGGSFAGPPNYQANNSDNDTNLRVTNFPANLLVTPGDFIYVTEIYTRHQLLTPLDHFGIVVPSTLYSIAYF
jgi:hypothetical protein